MNNPFLPEGMHPYAIAWTGAIEFGILCGAIVILEDTDDYPMVIPVHDWAVEIESALTSY